MSGIIGILNLDGAPVDPVLLGRLTRFLAPRGPDAQRTWIDGNVGFGHALLITDPGTAQCPQPCTVDGHAWITAHARLDARQELLDKLLRRKSANDEASDAELILHAYSVWGEDCLDHLFGEFVFAIWDGERRRLFCAHDQLGTRPIYFAQPPGQVIFSNTLDCVRQHPAVSSKVNDAAIGDFLLFGPNYNPETTFFSDIRRLPPAHAAVWEAGRQAQRRYWQMPIDEPLFYRRRGDYIEEFRGLLRTAVGERLPRGKVGVFMSGGLDSPLLAATAQQLKRECGSSGEVFAFTVLYDRLIPDQERHYSALVARYLGIQQHIYVGDGPDGVELWWQVPTPCAEPAPTRWALNQARDQYRRMMDLSRVFLYGEGPDNALRLERMVHFRYLIRRRRWVRLSKDLCLFMWLYRRKPLLSTLLRMIRRARAKSASMPVLPGWLNPEFCARLRLEQRWRETMAAPASNHPLRPVGYGSFQSPLWQGLFEACDSAFGQFPLEFRHPYLNLPLLRFLLRLPTLPWCHAKYILRVAARGLLPEEIVRRPKAPLAGFPEVEMVKRHGLPALFPATWLRDYLLPEKVCYDSVEPVSSVYADLRAVSLSYWLRDLERFSKNRSEESLDETPRQRTAN